MKTPASKPGLASAPALRLLELIRLCKESAGKITTNDHAAMDEIEQALANAEAAIQNLLAALVAGDVKTGIVDIDDF